MKRQRGDEDEPEPDTYYLLISGCSPKAYKCQGETSPIALRILNRLLHPFDETSEDTKNFKHDFALHPRQILDRMVLDETFYRIADDEFPEMETFDTLNACCYVLHDTISFKRKRKKAKNRKRNRNK